MITVAGRRVKLALGRGRTQTINICTEAGVHGQYDWVVAFDAGTFSSETDLLQRHFTTINEFVDWLERTCGGTVRQSPIRQLLVVPGAVAEGPVGLPSQTGQQDPDNSGILDGARPIITKFFGLPPGITLRTTTAARLVSANGPAATGSGVAFVRELYSAIERNAGASTRTPSTRNWRFQKQLYIHPANPNREKQIEKRIATVGGAAWTNQMPTASGLITSGERQRNVDLVHRLSRHCYELIELKDDSDTPFYAAIEILRYGLTFLYSRRNHGRLQYDETANPVLWTDTVHLCVLAPGRFFSGYALSWLARSANEGLAALIDPASDGALAMDMGFQKWPESFTWPCSDGALRAALDVRSDPYSESTMS